MDFKSVIMVGVPGSGKSTYVKEHFKSAYVCSADDFHIENGVYNFKPENVEKAHGKCLRDYVAGLAYGDEVVVVDNTNLSVAEIAPYYSLARAYLYEVEFVVFQTDPQEAFKRQTHGVPEQVHQRMWDKLKNLAFPTYWNAKITIITS